MFTGTEWLNCLLLDDFITDSLLLFIHYCTVSSQLGRYAYTPIYQPLHDINFKTHKRHKAEW